MRKPKHTQKIAQEKQFRYLWSISLLYMFSLFLSITLLVSLTTLGLSLLTFFHYNFPSQLGLPHFSLPILLVIFHMAPMLQLLSHGYPTKLAHIFILSFRHEHQFDQLPWPRGSTGTLMSIELSLNSPSVSCKFLLSGYPKPGYGLCFPCVINKLSPLVKLRFPCYPLAVFPALRVEPFDCRL